MQRPVGNNYRKRRLCDLTSDDVVDIAHARFVDDRERRDIAQEYRVSIGLVSRVCRKCKDNGQYVEELRAK